MHAYYSMLCMMHICKDSCPLVMHSHYIKVRSPSQVSPQSALVLCIQVTQRQSCTFELVILTNISVYTSVHYNAEIECVVIHMMQLKNLHENITVERVYDLCLEWACNNFVN